MLYFLHYLAESDPDYSFLRLFKYVTFRAGGAAMTAFLVALLFGGWTVRQLQRFQFHHEGRAEDQDPDATGAKQETPIMGGLLIVGAIVISMLLWADPTSALGMIFLGTLVALGGVGFADDYIKVRVEGRDGLPGRMKLILQIVIAVTAVWLLDWVQDGPSTVRMFMVPFLKDPVSASLPLAAAVAFGAFVVVGSSNAVNLSDGMDGLAIGCTIVSVLTYALFAYVCGHKEFADYLAVPYVRGSSEVVVIATAMAGAGLGFLWHNCYPASMFMGDTGSLALGGAVGLIAVLVKQELLLILVGGVFVIEAGSVILQVSYFKLTRRLTGEPKRLFKCAPIHIHFRRQGFKETQIVIRFWILAMVLAAMGLATLKVR